MNDFSSYNNSNTSTRLMFPSSSSSSEISQIMHHHHHHHHHQPSSSSWSSQQLLPQAAVLHQNNSSSYNPFSQYPTRNNDPFHIFPPTPPTHPQLLSCYGGALLNRSSTDHVQGDDDDHDILMGGGKMKMMMMMSAQEIMDAKALAASKSHSEAERRRRERINNHLAKLRSLLPSTTKTDKASLLAEVIQHVKELKRQTSIIAEQSPVVPLIPTEIDELTVDKVAYYSDEHHRNLADGVGVGVGVGNKLVIRASLCCDDPSDLLPDLIKTLKALRLRTLKAEITTLGGRVKNVLFITTQEQEEQDDDINNQEQQTVMNNMIISSIQEALKQVMEKSSSNGRDHHDSSSSIINGVKRQRTNNMHIIYP